MSFPVVRPACFFLIEVPDNRWIFRKSDLDIALASTVPAFFRICEDEINAGMRIERQWRRRNLGAGRLL
jgi:hypothetical protein